MTASGDCRTRGEGRRSDGKGKESNGSLHGESCRGDVVDGRNRDLRSGLTYANLVDGKGRVLLDKQY